MAETITIPGTNKKLPRWVLIAGGAGILIVVLILSKRKQQAEPAEGEYYNDYANEAASLAPAVASSIETSKLPSEYELTEQIPAYVESYGAPFQENYAYPATSGVFSAPFVDPGLYPLPEASLDTKYLTARPVKMATEAEATARSVAPSSQARNPAAERVLLTVMRSTKTKTQAQPESRKETPSTTTSQPRPTTAPAKPVQSVSTTRPGAARPKTIAKPAQPVKSTRPGRARAV